MPRQKKHSIGTEKERSLHRALKARYAGETGEIEAKRGRYVCDGVTAGGELLEIQTGSFAPLRKKAPALLSLGPLRIVHPIILRKTIVRYGADGTLLSRRKSPYKGTPWDLFRALRFAPELPLLQGLTIELALVEVEEEWVQDGQGSWKRRGESIRDRRLEASRGAITLRSVKDYRQFLPVPGGEVFTSRTLVEAAAITPHLARQTLFVLSGLGLVSRLEKRGTRWLYRRGW